MPTKKKNAWERIKKPILCLAPMAGITDSAFRLICRQQGADIVYSEMANVTALHYNARKTLSLIRFSSPETPYIVQIFGKNPVHFATASQKITKGIPLIHYRNSRDKSLLKKSAKPWGIDINFGCPAKKVFNHGSGAALMNNPALSKRIIQEVVANTDLPVSIKVRTEAKGVKLLDFLKKISTNKLGLSAIMVHGRTLNQGFSGPIDTKVIKNTKKYFDGIVIANGGIKNVEDADEIIEKTGADGVAVATGVYGNPQIFEELIALKEKNKPRKTNDLIKNNRKNIESKIAIALKHAEYAANLKGNHGILEMRKHLLWYFKSYPNIKQFRPQIVQVKSLKDVNYVVNKIFLYYNSQTA